jgi:hypothetical protein
MARKPVQLVYGHRFHRVNLLAASGALFHESQLRFEPLRDHYVILESIVRDGRQAANALLIFQRCL